MVSLPVAAVTAFTVVGGITALWAVLLAFLGLSRPEFPPKGGVRIVIAISALLVAGSIGTAIGTSKTAKKTVAGSPTKAAPSKASGSNAAAPAPSGGGAAATGGAGATLSLSADPSGALRFNTTSLQAKAGPVRLRLTNPAPLGHNISLRGPGVDQQGPTVQRGQTSTVSATLKPGSYTFYCSVPGHSQAGMQGTLTVK